MWGIRQYGFEESWNKDHEVFILSKIQVSHINTYGVHFCPFGSMGRT